MVKTHLTFINASYDIHRTSAVIIQKNDVISDTSRTIAWKVIKNCGYLCYHPFTFSLSTSMILADSVGNRTAPFQVEPGNVYRVYQERSGHIRTYTTSAHDRITIQVQNMCDREVICCQLYRDQRLLALQEPILPQQYALFRFRPSIFVAPISRIEEGSVLPPATVAAFTTECHLLGITSAELVMTGGGSGPYAMPLRVHMQHSKDWPVSTGDVWWS